MTSEEIKSECQKMYAVISSARERLTELRRICKHEHTFQGEYEWATAHTFPAIICDDCGEVVQNLLFHEEQTS